MIYLNDSNFKNEISKSTLPCIVDFFAEWCGPCKTLAPVFDELSKEYEGKCNFFKVNVDDANGVAADYSVMSIPTIIIFKDSQKVATNVGAMSKDAFKDFINKNI